MNLRNLTNITNVSDSEWLHEIAKTYILGAALMLAAKSSAFRLGRVTDIEIDSRQREDAIFVTFYSPGNAPLSVALNWTEIKQGLQ